MYLGSRVLALLLTLVAGAADAQVVLSPTHYDLDFELDYASEMLRGTVRIVVENPSSSPLDSASLLLYRLLRVRAAGDDQGRNLGFTQTVVRFEDFGKLHWASVIAPRSAASLPACRARRT